MELFVDEAASRTLLPRVDGQVVEAKLVALLLTCTVGMELNAKGYFSDNDDDDDNNDDAKSAQLGSTTRPKVISLTMMMMTMTKTVASMPGLHNQI